MCLIANNDDKSLSISNERKEVVTGNISDKVLVVPGWDVTGQLSSDKQSLSWSNGVVWRRCSQRFAP